jgi:hypothetical protein
MSDSYIDTVVTADSPWHAGELMIQEAAGVAQKMDVLDRKVIHDYLVEQHCDSIHYYPLSSLAQSTRKVVPVRRYSVAIRVFRSHRTRTSCA